MNKEQIAVIAGMPRALTTFLYYTLPDNPHIKVTYRKEVDYFSVINAKRPLSWYKQFFKGITKDQVGLDVTPNYFMDMTAPDRMVEFNPDIKVILIIRDPVDWILSFYKHLRKIFYEDIPFDDFLENGFDFSKEGGTLHYDFHDGCIKETVELYKKKCHNLLICDFSAQTPLPILNAIEDFLEIPRYFNASNFENLKINTARRKSIKPINWLKRQKLIVDIIQAVFPKRVIYYVKKKLALYLIKDVKEGDEIDPSYRKKAKKHFKKDRAYVKELFSGKPIIRINR